MKQTDSLCKAIGIHWPMHRKIYKDIQRDITRWCLFTVYAWPARMFADSLSRPEGRNISWTPEHLSVVLVTVSHYHFQCLFILQWRAVAKQHTAKNEMYPSASALLHSTVSLWLQPKIGVLQLSISETTWLNLQSTAFFFENEASVRKIGVAHWRLTRAHKPTRKYKSKLPLSPM